MVFLSYAVWPHMSVAENIGYPSKIRGAARAEIDARVEQMLGMLEMAGLGARMPSPLSGGQQQRVALGRALALSSSSSAVSTTCPAGSPARRLPPRR